MEKKKEHDKAYYDWSSRWHERIMEALDKHYFSIWFIPYSKYLDAEREKAGTEYSLEQLKQKIPTYEEFAAEREKEILSDKALDGDMMSVQASKEVETEKTLLRSCVRDDGGR